MTAFRDYARFFGRFAVKALLVCAVGLIVASAYCLVTGGWTVLRFVNAASVLGLVTAALGALSTAGSAQLGSHSTYQVARTASVASGGDRARQDFRDSDKRIGFTWMMAGGGVLTILAAYVVGHLLLP